MLLELQGVTKKFPGKKNFWGKTKDYVRAVDRVDLTMQEGENIGLVGESGCGKTTLGRTILRLIPFDSGKIIFDGEDISRFTTRKLMPYRVKVQMVFQDPYSSLDPRFTIRDILKEAMLFDRNKTETEKERQIEKLLSEVHLSKDVMNRFPHEFSGGERQRIAIARALIRNPKLLILDEAVSSLDVLVQGEIIKLLDEVQKKFNVTYLFVSHNLRVVKKISHKIAVMYRGKIVELAASDEIFKNPLHPYTRELLSAAVEYKSTKNTIGVKWDDNSRLIDRGGGHFVIN